MGRRIFMQDIGLDRQKALALAVGWLIALLTTFA